MTVFIYRNIDSRYIQLDGYRQIENRQIDIPYVWIDLYTQIYVDRQMDKILNGLIEK